MQVQQSIDLTFAAGVRTLLRQDPDIIMVGEIRDLETAQMAVQAALTGHLVLSTLHTNDAPSAITRLLDLGVPHYLIQSTVNGIVAQRLARTLCPRCKHADRGRPGSVAGTDARIRSWRCRSTRVHGQGLRRLPPHRLLRPHRRVRNADDVPEAAPRDPSRHRPAGVRRILPARRPAAVAPGRRGTDRARPDHGQRGGVGIADDRLMMSGHKWPSYRQTLCLNSTREANPPRCDSPPRFSIPRPDARALHPVA
jgi:hypothetical protein